MSFQLYRRQVELSNMGPSSSFIAFPVVIVVTILFQQCVTAQDEDDESTTPAPYSCTQTPRHTLCRYPGPSRTCSIRNNGVDLASQDLILRVHNRYRRRVAAGREIRGNPGPQPGASRMPSLSWNLNLQIVAQRWADQCTFRSDEYRNIAIRPGEGPIWVGQNVYAYLDFARTVPPYSSTLQQQYWQEAIDRWYDEVDRFNRDSVSRYRYDPATGKYTQLVWGNTTDVGCGFTQFNYPNSRIARILVCNYGPGGNQIGFPVYNRTIPTTTTTTTTTTDDPCSVNPDDAECQQAK